MDNLFIKQVLQYLYSITPCGMSHCLVNGYYFEWIGTHWEFVGISKPSDVEHKVLDLDDEY